MGSNFRIAVKSIDVALLRSIANFQKLERLICIYFFSRLVFVFDVLGQIGPQGNLDLVFDSLTSLALSI